MSFVSVKTHMNFIGIYRAMYEDEPPDSEHSSESVHSNHLHADEIITQEELSRVSAVLLEHKIRTENIRVVKKTTDGTDTILQARQASIHPYDYEVNTTLADDILLSRGDHSADLKKVCAMLSTAQEFAPNDDQRQRLLQYIECFTNGNPDLMPKSLDYWFVDQTAKVTNTFGFFDTHRQPAPIGAPWVGLVGVVDADKTERTNRFYSMYKTFIRRLPWAVPGVNDGLGPFENGHAVMPGHALFYGM